MKIEFQKKHYVTAILFTVLLAADILTKYLVELKIGLYERVNAIGSFVQLTKLYNQGGVWGIFQGHQMVFLIISLVVLILLFLFYFFEKNKTTIFCVAMGMIFSGAIGNIIDRISGRPGVVDFVYIGVDKFFRWPAFNVADSAIVVGAILLIIVFYLQEKGNKKNKNI